MSLDAYEPIIDRMVEIIKDVWEVDRVIVGEPQHDPQDPQWAVIDCNGIERTREGPRAILERHSFDIIGIFPRQPGDREQVFLLGKAKVLIDELEADTVFVTNLANNLMVTNAGRLEELPTEQERCGCFVRLTVDSFDHAPAD